MNEPPGKETSSAKKKRGGNRALIRFAAVLLVLGIAGGFPLFYSFRTAYRHTLNYAGACQLIRLLDDAVRQYKQDVGTCPSSLQGLLENVDRAEKWNGPYIKPGIPRDPWGNEFHYVFPGRHGEFDIYSLGSDGRKGDGKKGERLSARNQAGDLGNWDIVERHFYDFELATWDGQVIRTADLKGKVVLVVNTSMTDLFTPQYARLEEIYRKYRDRGFEILDFPGTQFTSGKPKPASSFRDAEIHSFRTSRYGVTFPQMAETGSEFSPIYSSFLGLPQWYFTKYLVGRDGKVVRCFAPDAAFNPADTMDELERCIQSLLDAPPPAAEDAELPGSEAN